MFSIITKNTIIAVEKLKNTFFFDFSNSLFLSSSFSVFSLNLYPNFPISSFIFSTLIFSGLYFIDAFSVAKFILIFSTPSIFANLFSIIFAQLEQCIPSICKLLFNDIDFSFMGHAHSTSKFINSNFLWSKFHY